MKISEQNTIKWLWIDCFSILVWTSTCISLDGLSKLNSEIGVYLLILAVIPIILAIVGTNSSTLRKHFAKYLTNWVTLAYFAYVILISFDYGQDFSLKSIIATVAFLIIEIGLFIFNFKRR